MSEQGDPPHFGHVKNIKDYREQVEGILTTAASHSERDNLIIRFAKIMLVQTH